MNDRIFTWFVARPRWIAIAVLVFAVDAWLLAAWLLDPLLQSAFAGPDPVVCSRAARTQARRDIAACCAQEDVHPWPICEGTSAERRREAQDERAVQRNLSSREQWARRQPSHYRYTFRFGCFYCPGITGFTFTSDVHGGVPTLAAAAGDYAGERADLSWAGKYATMDRVFDAVEAAIRQNPYYFVEYSKEWGYPSELDWGVLYVTDAVTMFNVIDFQVLP